MKKVILMLWLVGVVAANGAVVDKDSEYYKVYRAALKVQQNNGEGFSTIIKCAKYGDDVELSRAAVKVIILAMKKRGSKSITTFAKDVLKKFPGENMLGFLKEEPLAKLCSKCGGTGKATEKLKCSACQGKKYIITKEAVNKEYINAVKELVEAAPALAAAKGIYIGVDSKPVKKDPFAELDDDSTPKTDADYATLEVINYLKMQEKRSQEDICSNVEIKKVENQWTLILIAGKDYLTMSKDHREQVAEGFYKFWVLRAGRNRLRGSVNMQILTPDGTLIAQNKGKEIWVK